MKWHSVVVISFISLFFHQINIGNGTIDVNTVQYQYLADHLKEAECRELVASLHFRSFAMPNALYQAERKVPKDLTCLQQLLHWNSELNGGQKTTHEILSRRLKQINRDDLALWLTNAAFDSVHKEFQRSINIEPIRMYEPIHLPHINFTSSPTTVAFHVYKVTTEEPHIRVAKQNAPADPLADVLVDPTEWTIFDTISWTIVIILFLLVVVLLVYLTLASPCFNQKKRCDVSPCEPEPSPSDTGMRGSTVAAQCQPTCQAEMYPVHVQHQQHISHHQQQSHHPHHSECHRKHECKPCYKDHNYMINKIDHHPPLVCQRELRECQRECQRERDCSPMKSYGLSDQTSYLPSPCMGPQPPRPICPNAICPAKIAEYDHRNHFNNNLSRTIDIHQKIAIPMNNLESSN